MDEQQMACRALRRNGDRVRGGDTPPPQNTSGVHLDSLGVHGGGSPPPHTGTDGQSLTGPGGGGLAVSHPVPRRSALQPTVEGHTVSPFLEVGKWRRREIKGLSTAVEPRGQSQGGRLGLPEPRRARLPQAASDPALSPPRPPGSADHQHGREPGVRGRAGVAPDRHLQPVPVRPAGRALLTGAGGRAQLTAGRGGRGHRHPGGARAGWGAAGTPQGVGDQASSLQAFP